MAQGPYPYPPQGPPPMGPPPPQMMPAPIYAPPAQTDSKAVVSLILGLLSLVCCTGILTGIPAIVLGAMAKRDISRSGGALGGDGLAIGGIVTGGLSTFGTIVYIIFNVALFTAMGTGSPTFTPPPPYIPTPAYTTPLSTGAIHAVELKHTAGALKDQLVSEITAAKGAGEDVLVYVYTAGALACTEFDGTLTDYDMQRVLAHVRLVRVESSEFADLASLGMQKPSYPWFFKVEAVPTTKGEDLRVTDAISGDEWSDNYAYNIWPVLEQFLNGTYVKHASPSAMGAGGDGGASSSDSGSKKPALKGILQSPNNMGF